jgi:CBS domain-containing protein/ribosome-associated translation inhibitor RaiA
MLLKRFQPKGNKKVGTMDMKKPLVVDSKEPLSKVMETMIKTGLPVAVTENGKYAGMIDDRHLSFSIKHPEGTHAGMAMVNAPTIDISESNNVEMLIKKFLAGRFKGLAVVDGRDRVQGLITKADLIKELIVRRMIPNVSVSAVMVTPVYTVDISERIGTVKSLMKELKTRRLIAVDNGKVKGVISTFDFLLLLERPRPGKDTQFKTTINSGNSIQIGQLIRGTSVMVGAADMLPSVASEIARNNSAYAVVVDRDSQPIGIIPSIDLLKLVLKLSVEAPSVFVSGLGGEDLFYYDDAKNVLAKAISKFSQSFRIDHMDVRVKKGKSSYAIHANVNVDGHIINIQAESHEVMEGFIALVNEFESILRRMKSKRKNKNSSHHIMLEEGEYA